MIPADLTRRINAVKAYIMTHWDETIKHPDESESNEIRLPHPCVVPTPGPMFHNFFYWDTYFASEGLLRSRRVDQVLHNANNILYLIEKFGYVPGSTQTWGQNRSQPPVASALVRLVYETTRDKTWLARASRTLEREYGFWMTMRRGPCGLNYYGYPDDPHALRAFCAGVRDRLGGLPGDLTERMQVAAHAMAETESGWDFTPRFDDRCADFYAIDLNALLFMHEENAAWFCAELGLPEASLWRARAERRGTLLNEYCWNEELGTYVDWDRTRATPSTRVTAASYVMLWSGAATADRAERMVEQLRVLERTHGIVACVPGPRKRAYQWDAPNAWPPLQHMALAGLRRYGRAIEMKRLALKVVVCIVKVFESTGALWEKYDAVSGGMDVVNEYDMPPMLGWTAGVFMYGCDLLEV